MKTILKFGIAFCLAGTLSYARDWNGKLMDAGCFDKNAPAAKSGNRKAGLDVAKTCAPTKSTTEFAFQSAASGRVYKLDEQSNDKAEKAIEKGAVKPSKDGEYRAFVSGTHKTGQMVVNDISGQKYHGSSVY